MEWQIGKLDEGDTVFGSKTSGRYWVIEFDLDDGSEKSGCFFETLDEAVAETLSIEKRNR